MKIEISHSGRKVKSNEISGWNVSSPLNGYVSYEGRLLNLVYISRNSPLFDANSSHALRLDSIPGSRIINLKTCQIL